MFFADRAEAGRQLAARLTHLRDREPLVLGLPRGGVPVAVEVAAALGAPLDVLVVHKIALPFRPETALGAVAEGDVLVINDEYVRAAGLSQAEFGAVAEQERTRVEHRAARFRHGHTGAPLAGRTVVLVDDGIVTGATARAACRVARAAGAVTVVLAVPIASRAALAMLRDEVDEIVCLFAPAKCYAVGQWYVHFPQTTDEDVERILHLNRSGRPGLVNYIDLTARDDEVNVHSDGIWLRGRLTVPASPEAVVILADGDSHHDVQADLFVAAELNRVGFATLTVDLLTTSERWDSANLFDVPLLANRLEGTTRWVRTTDVGAVPVGYLGTGSGAAAALWAAAAAGTSVAAVVCRSGRPDLARRRLPEVTAATLFVVAEHDDGVVADLNRAALAYCTCPAQFAVVPRSSHTFTEPGALEAFTALARDWFTAHLAVSGLLSAAGPRLV